MRTIIINNFATFFVALPLALPAAVANGDDTSHRYVVRVDEAMQHLDVEAHFATTVQSIAARSKDAHRYLSDMRDCNSGETLLPRGRRLSLTGKGVQCIRYRVDLASAAGEERRNARLALSNLIVSPATWFWRPPSDSAITVRFDVEESVRVSVPWYPVAGKPHTYRLPRSPESSAAAAVFGDFEYHEANIPGAVLRITIPRSDSETETAELVEWVRSAASNVTLAYGEFPNPSPSVVVLPAGDTRSSDSPVRFGRVVRDGGETIELFVDRSMPIDTYYDDWTATHEFSHLMLPYLNSRHRWISEGFAQYYQNVLLARAGQYTEQRAWQKLYEGLERGRKSSPALSPNRAAAGGASGSTMKVYWSGAALALLADVELRKRSDGERSLDDVLKALNRCCLPADEMWSGIRLFETLDSFLDQPLFMPLYRRHADTAGFPDVRPLLVRLGVVVDDGAVRLNPGAELSGLRRAVTGR